jgi:hypothetical protein
MAKSKRDSGLELEAELSSIELDSVDEEIYLNFNLEPRHESKTQKRHGFNFFGSPPGPICRGHRR